MKLIQNNDRNNGQYDEGNDKGIKIDTEVVKPFFMWLC